MKKVATDCRDYGGKIEPDLIICNYRNYGEGGHSIRNNLCNKDCDCYEPLKVV